MDNYCESLDELFRHLSEVKDDLSQIEQELREAEEIVDEMKIHIIAVSDQKDRNNYIKKIARYKESISKHKKLLLVGDIGDSSQRVKHVDSVKRAHESLDILNLANAQLAQAESTGIETLKNLNQQEDTLRNINKNVEQVNAQLRFSNKLINKLGKWWRA